MHSQVAYPTTHTDFYTGLFICSISYNIKKLRHRFNNMWHTQQHINLQVHSYAIHATAYRHSDTGSFTCTYPTTYTLKYRLICMQYTYIIKHLDTGICIPSIPPQLINTDAGSLKCSIPCNIQTLRYRFIHMYIPYKIYTLIQAHLYAVYLHHKTFGYRNMHTQHTSTTYQHWCRLTQMQHTLQHTGT